MYGGGRITTSVHFRTVHFQLHLHEYAENQAYKDYLYFRYRTLTFSLDWIQGDVTFSHYLNLKSFKKKSANLGPLGPERSRSPASTNLLTISHFYFSKDTVFCYRFFLSDPYVWKSKTYYFVTYR